MLAALFNKRDNLAEAEELLRGALQLASKRFGKTSKNVKDINIKLSDLLARQAGPLWDSGRPGEAAAVLRESIDRNPENPLAWHCLAVSLLATGDREGHRKVCATALERLSRSTDRDAFEVARAYALAPGDVDNLAVARRLAKHGLEGQPDAGWTLYTMGLVHYRSGEHEQAILIINEACNSNNKWHADVLYSIVLAMAHHQLGHTAEALRCLEKAHDTRGDQARDIKPGEVISSNTPWWDRADYQVLLREADELILDSAFPDDPFQP
jgi:tetratricopeptide (TPR) repeat protein